MKTRFSTWKKLLIIFDLLIAFATILEASLAVQTARSSVIEKIETHLTDKTTDVAEVLAAEVDKFKV